MVSTTFKPCSLDTLESVVVILVNSAIEVMGKTRVLQMLRPISVLF